MDDIGVVVDKPRRKRFGSRIPSSGRESKKKEEEEEGKGKKKKRKREMMID